MRVASNTFANQLIKQFSDLNVRQGRLQQQAATGQRVTVPSDDPVAMRRVMDLEAESKRNEQYRHNIARQQELATVSSSAMRNLNRIMSNVTDIATSVDSLKPGQDLKIYAKNVTEAIKDAVQQANTKSHDDYIFGGTKSDKPPYVIKLDAAGNVESVTYQGNTDTAEVEIAQGVTISSQSIGSNSTGSGPSGVLADSQAGVDCFKDLITLQNQLLQGDVSGILNSTRQALIKDTDNIVYQTANNAAIQSRLQVTDDFTAQRNLAINGRVSEEADADIAETIVRLTQTQTAYQAALQSASRLLNTSLLDYIR